jgi:iron complex outermembrane receptor protein
LALEEQKTYQSWNGLEDLDLLKMIELSIRECTQMHLEIVFDNETDNYQQDHYQLHWNEKSINELED